MADLISSNLSDDEKNAWGTDPLIYNPMNEEFNFDLDAAASKNNSKCHFYIGIKEDSLTVDWSKMFDGEIKTVWINPPYGRGCIKPFMDKCVEQKQKGVTSVMLVPSTLDALWLPINDISEIRIITGGRLSFHHPTTNKKVAGNTKGSMFVIFRPSNMPCFARLIDRDELIASGRG